MKTITPNELSELVSYDALTGIMAWKPRPLKYCGTPKKQDAMNKRILGKMAFNSKHAQGYLHGSVCGEHILAHRAAWALHYGEWPDGLIDHINGDRTDNRIENLRCVCDTGNAKNSSLRSDNTSGSVGIYWIERTKRWRARIYVNGAPVHLGYFETKDDAIAARKKAEAENGYHPNHGRNPRR